MNWRKYTETPEGYNEEDPKKVLDEEWEFLAKNWWKYLLMLPVGLAVIAIYVTILLSIISMVVNGPGHFNL